MAAPNRTDLKTGTLVPLSIDAVAFGGQGVGRSRDLVVFVPFTVEGDEGIVEITEIKKRYAHGEMKTLTTPSPHRTEPLCRAFGRCGGCQYQHIAYGHQLTVKARQVRDAFFRIGRFSDVPLADALFTPDPWHYRGKAEVHIRKAPHRDPAVGFTRALSHEVLDIEHCEIVGPGINEALGRLRQEVRASRDKWVDRRVVLWSEDECGSSSTGTIIRRVKGKDLLVPRDGFFQANRLLADTLVDVVLDMSALTGTETVIDAYSGSGFFSVFLAPLARRFCGIEFAGEAVRAAELNLKNAGIDEAELYEGDVGDVLRDIFAKDRRNVDLLVVDPPRVGLDASALAAVARLRPSRIVYVSCNPATMARDIRYLADCGFLLERLQPIDMFPQTGHIEVVGLLTVDKGGGT